MTTVKARAPELDVHSTSLTSTVSDRATRSVSDQLARRHTLPNMASKLCRNRALASALRPTSPSIQGRGEAAVRCFAVTSRQNVAMPMDTSNPRDAPRKSIGPLKAPLVNPADKYQSKADNLHKYGSWLMSCLPKYIQQFSVWKDELTIYICPSGVIPVFSFLKSRTRSSSDFASSDKLNNSRQHVGRVHPA